MKTKNLGLALCLGAMLFLSAARQVGDLNIKEMVPRLHPSGSFQIFVAPEKFNILVDDEISFSGWTSHIPLNGQVVQVAHHGTDHNLLYDYDTHVPLVFWGPGHVKRGESTKRVSIMDIAPTLADILHVVPPAAAKGSALTDFRLPGKEASPKALLLFVIDQGGWFTLQQHQGHWPHLEQLMKEGFLFKEEYVDYGAAGTAASHAAIGTGAYPAESGIYDNKPFYRSHNKQMEVYTAPDGVEIYAEEKIHQFRYLVRNQFDKIVIKDGLFAVR